MDAAPTQEVLDNASARLLIELAFLIPRGDQERFNEVKTRLLAYRAALVATLERKWHPIETAPKDGTWIAVCSWHNPYYHGCVQWVNGQWWRDNDRPDDLFEGAATHYTRLPLPDPPSPEEPRT